MKLKDHDCPSFKSLRQNEDLNGYSILPNHNELAPYKLQMRCIDQKFEEEFRVAITGKQNFNVKITGEIAIKFCPWCGEKL